MVVAFRSAKVVGARASARSLHLNLVHLSPVHLSLGGISYVGAYFREATFISLQVKFDLHWRF